MGNKCNCIGHNQSTDEAEDALLGNREQQRSRQQQQGGHQQQQQQYRIMRLPGRQVTRNVPQTPREPPPPYQQVNPFYVLTEEQRLHIITRLTLIRSLPIGHYELKEKKIVPLEKELCEKSDKSENRECPICMNEFLQGDPIRLLPCMHYYHTRCIDEWLMRAITCPNCMQRVDIAFQRTTDRGHRRSVSRGSATNIVVASPSRNTSFDQLTTPSISAPPTPSSSTPSLPLSGNPEATRNVSFNI